MLPLSLSLTSNPARSTGSPKIMAEELTMALQNIHSQVSIPVGRIVLEGDVNIPAGARSIVIFAHGSGSSRHSPRNRYVANTLGQAGLATLLFDLLTASEEAIDLRTARLRFDIDFLAERV